MSNEIERKAYNSLLFAMRDFEVIDEDKLIEYSLSKKTENGLIIETFEKNPEKLVDVLKKQVDYFTEGNYKNKDFEKGLKDYHKKLGKYIDVEIKTYGPNTVIKNMNCPYKFACQEIHKNEEFNDFCIRKISLEHLLEKNGISNKGIAVENDCTIVIYHIPDKDIQKLNEVVLEAEKIGGKINSDTIIEVLLREYQSLNEDHQQ